MGAQSLWDKGITGTGVDIAVIDTGVAPVPGLAGKIVNGPDLSLDVPYSKFPGLDAYGHGTHMASIAAGRDADATNLSDPTKFVGVAPGSRILNVKVGAFDGATDVSQVIAAIDWVVQHKNDNGLNVKVLNLSYGTASPNAWMDDPLAWAAEVAWRNGIVVVAAAGNDGSRTAVTSPAVNPMVLAVGAADQRVQPVTPELFTNASGYRQPDLWAPGVSVLGLRVPGSFADTAYPNARVGTRLIKGTGTSQATAVVSGAAALLASAHPKASPNQIKTALVLSGQNVDGKIAGFVDVAKAHKYLASGMVFDISNPTASTSRGAGSLEGARGGLHLVWNGVELIGERDIFGKNWIGQAWSDASRNLTSWTGGTFNGSTWTGASWAGASWAGASWTGASWAGASWAGASWAGASWAGASWAGAAWRSSGWRGAVWG
jgi:serine protease AprX